MKKIILLTGVLLLAIQCADAGIISKVFNNDNYYNNGFYPYNGVYHNPNYHNHQNYCPYHYRNYPQRYHNHYPRNYYYNQQPIIYRTRVRRSLSNTNEKLVSNRVSELNKIEQKVFNQTFEYDNEKNRIERLERKMFGAQQTGTLDERLIVLKSASKSFKAFNPENTYSNNVYDNYRPPVFTGTMGSNWRNTLWGNFKNQFAGMPTGFTPAMDPAYMDYFEAERAMMGNSQNTYQQTNQGYNYSNINRGAKTGVTILD